MNREQVLGIIRHILTFGGGLAVSWGWVGEADIPQVVGAVLTLIGVGWSFFSPTKQT